MWNNVTIALYFVVLGILCFIPQTASLMIRLTNLVWGIQTKITKKTLYYWRFCGVCTLLLAAFIYFFDNLILYSGNQNSETFWLFINKLNLETVFPFAIGFVSIFIGTLLLVPYTFRQIVEAFNIIGGRRTKIMDITRIFGLLAGAILTAFGLWIILSWRL